MGTRLRTASLRVGFVVVSEGDRADLSGRLCLIRSAVAGTYRKPWHPAVNRIHRRHPQPSWNRTLLVVPDGVLDGPKRSRDSGHVLDGDSPVAAFDFQHPATTEPLPALCALSFALLCRPGFHGFSMGRALTRNRVPRTHSELRDEAGYLAIAMAAVPLYVSFRCRQAPEPRPG